MTDRERDARLAVRWFGWQWWRDTRTHIRSNRCALLPPEDNRCNWPIEPYASLHHERCVTVPPPEERFIDWWYCWCDKPLPHFSTDGNAILSLEAKLFEQRYKLRTKRYDDGRHSAQFSLDDIYWEHKEVFAGSLPEAVAAAADMIPEPRRA